MRPVTQITLLILLMSWHAARAEAQQGGGWCEVRVAAWHGEPDELRRIREIPLPESFRRALAGPCARLQGTLRSLLDWHLDFGDVASTTAALAELETVLLPKRADIAEHRRQLVQIWRRVYPELLEAEPLLHGSDLQFSRATERLNRSSAVRELRNLLQTHNVHIALADEYLRAAEFHRSVALLERGQLYVQAIVRTRDDLRMSALPRRAALSVPLGRFHLNIIDDLELRAALLTADLGGSATSTERAIRVLRRHDRDLADDLARLAGVRPAGACQHENVPERLASVCVDRAFQAPRTINYWRARAQLDLLLALNGEPPAGRMMMGSEGVDTVSRALQLLDEERRTFLREHNPQPQVDDAMVNLYLRRAALRTAQARREDDAGIAAALNRRALADIEEAARLVPAESGPGRRRRIISQMPTTAGLPPRL